MMSTTGMPNMAMVNVSNFPGVKDSRWLQLEVCREFQRNKCTRSDTECKFAHSPPIVQVQNGRVIACYDSIKGRCNREEPPCKYYHPPQHLKDQLVINGKNHLAAKNAIMTHMQVLSPGTQFMPGTIPVHSSPYLAGIPVNHYNPYIASSPVMAMSMADTESMALPTGLFPPQVMQSQKVHRTYRLEAFPGSRGFPYKRPAAGEIPNVPMYQPTVNAAYQQALMQQQLGGQGFMPVSYLPMTLPPAPWTPGLQPCPVHPVYPVSQPSPVQPTQHSCSSSPDIPDINSSPIVFNENNISPPILNVNDMATEANSNSMTGSSIQEFLACQLLT